MSLLSDRFISQPDDSRLIFFAYLITSTAFGIAVRFEVDRFPQPTVLQKRHELRRKIIFQQLVGESILFR